MLTAITFPENIPNRQKYIFDQVVAGNFEASWVPLEYDIAGKKVKLDVMSDALKIGGVRVNVTATLQQQLADVFDASLLTAQIADLMYANATHRLAPSPQPISSSAQSMLAHSQRVDKLLGVYSGGIVSPVGKHWILDKKLEYARGKACNYGWHFTGASFNGITGFPAATLYCGKGAKVIQPNATAHDLQHTDYSQICQLVSQQCWIDGVEHKFSDLIKDPALCQFVTANGPLKNDRQSGVPQITGQQVLFPVTITP